MSAHHTPSRVAVIGDVGGHLAALETELTRLGVDLRERRIPESLTVVQVGDLVHRGPDSAGVVALVDELMRENPGRWVQLAGNHEQLYVAAPVFQWRDELDTATIETLQRWWNDGSMQLAWAFESSGIDVRRPGGVLERIGTGGVLVTHAGLTYGMWRELGAPSSASAVAAVINAERHEHTSRVWRPGRMLERWNNTHAGVVWAEAGHELLESWIAAQMAPGFHQVHGHSSAYWWRNAKWSPADLARRVDAHKADAARRVLRVEVSHQVIWGCDPQHGVDAAVRWSALEFAGS
jgi:hypothetical protein